MPVVLWWVLGGVAALVVYERYFFLNGPWHDNNPPAGLAAPGTVLLGGVQNVADMTSAHAYLSAHSLGNPVQDANMAAVSVTALVGSSAWDTLVGVHNGPPGSWSTVLLSTDSSTVGFTTPDYAVKVCGPGAGWAILLG